MRTWIVLACCFAISPFALAASRGEKERGAAIFKESGCGHCHAIANAGGHKGPDLSGVGRRRSKAAMREQIVTGSKVMPAFGEILGPEEIDDLVAYLRSCRQKPAKADRASAAE